MILESRSIYPYGLLSLFFGIIICVSCSSQYSTPTPTSIFLSPATEKTSSPILSSATVMPTSIIATVSPGNNDSNAIEARLFAKGYELGQSKTITLNNIIYRATIYKHPSQNKDRLLIYKKEETDEIVIYDFSKDLELIRVDGVDDFFSRVTIHFDSYKDTPTGWYDLNGDSFPELSLFISNYHIKCIPCVQIQVLQLHPQQGIKNLTLSVSVEDKLDFFSVQNITDINNDGVMEWLVHDNRYAWLDYNAGYGTRIYAWDGNTYRNASTQFPNYYQSKIDQLTFRLEEFGFVKSIEDISSEDSLYKKELYIGELIELLLAYDNIGRREEGWLIFETYVNPERYEENTYWWLKIWESFSQEYDSK